MVERAHGARFVWKPDEASHRRLICDDSIRGFGSVQVSKSDVIATRDATRCWSCTDLHLSAQFNYFSMTLVDRFEMPEERG